MAPIQADDRGPAINVGIWICLVGMGFSVLTKVYTKWTYLRGFQLDDFLIVAALLSATGCIVSTSEAVAFGLGRHYPSLDDSDIENLFKAAYSMLIFYVFTLCVTKLGCLYHFLVFTYSKQRRRALHITIGIVLAWGLTGLLTVSFRCQLPSPWLLVGTKCVDLRTFWTIYAVIDIITQVVVTLFPVWLLHDLHTTTARRLVAMLWFSPTILTVPVTIVRLVYIYDLFSTQDYSWDAFNFILVTNIHAALFVVTACIPFTKAMIDSLAVGVMSNDVRGVLIGRARSTFGVGGSSAKNGNGTPGASKREVKLWSGPGRSVLVSTVAGTKTEDNEEELQQLRSPDKPSDRLVIRYERSLTVSSESRPQMTPTPPV